MYLAIVKHSPPHFSIRRQAGVCGGCQGSVASRGDICRGEADCDAIFHLSIVAALMPPSDYFSCHRSEGWLLGPMRRKGCFIRFLRHAPKVVTIRSERFTRRFRLCSSNNADNKHSPLSSHSGSFESLTC